MSVNQADSGKKNQVGLIGPTNVGKTTYFAVLDRALEINQWLVDIYGDDSKADTEQLNNLRVRINHGYFPEKTQAGRESKRAIFRISRKLGPSFDLTFYDPAGELFESSDASAEYTEERERIFAYLATCSGLMVLLDLSSPLNRVFDNWQHSMRLFREYIQRYKMHELLKDNQLNMRTAVLFTKADTIPWLRLHRQRDAGTWMRGNNDFIQMLDLIRTQCNQVRFFFCSAIGWHDGKPNCRTLIRPRSLTVADDEATYDQTKDGSSLGQRPLIPDPAVGKDASPTAEEADTSRYSVNPVFTDPLRFTNEPLEEKLDGPKIGVVNLPRRRARDAQQLAPLKPWNVLEPLLWAAGIDSSAFEEA